jgi:hypothetical protein
VTADRSITQIVHEFAPDAGGVRKLVRVHPYLRLRGPADQPPVFLQDGKVYDEGGGLMDPPPKWIRDALKGVTLAARQAVGWGTDGPAA